MTCRLICQPQPGLDPDAADRICRDFLQILRQTYPDQAFHIARHATSGPALTLQIREVSPSATAIRLVWSDARMRVTEGLTETVSAMDRPVTQSMLISLFRRALLATPMPE